MPYCTRIKIGDQVKVLPNGYLASVVEVQSITKSAKICAYEIKFVVQKNSTKKVVISSLLVEDFGCTNCVFYNKYASLYRKDIIMYERIKDSIAYS